MQLYTVSDMAAAGPTSTDMSDATVGMIGLGNMGGRVARRIHEVGPPIVGYDVSTTMREESGLRTVDSSAALVDAVDVVFLCLPNSAIIEAVILEEGGVRDSVRAGQIVVDLSTASPPSTVALHAALAERGVAMVDGGLTGGVHSATTGEMTIMAGGEEDVIDRIRPVLASFAAAVYRMGPSGAGHPAKVLNNFLNGVALAATAEAMVAAKKANLDLTLLLEVFNRGSAVNWATRERFPSHHRGRLPGGRPLGRPDDQGHRSVPADHPVAASTEHGWARNVLRLPSRFVAGLRRADQQSRGRRPR